MTVEEMKARNEALLHAMQSGVAMMLTMPSICRSLEASEFGHKHLRTWVNAAMCAAAASVAVLLKKGIITEAEYWECANEILERDVRAYEAEISRIKGVKVTLA